MKKLLLLTVLVLVYGLCAAQTALIKGAVTDTINKQSLQNATISLLTTKDSVLVKFARSDAGGAFTLGGLKGGDYLLMVTYPQYADYVETITLADSATHNTGLIKLILKANLLKEVIVKQQLGAIRIKGDTTEFVADSFKVQANANVEDLLKKLPGIQIDKNGKITAQGETVQKVLVDGEEFFGDDPTLVTQNLRADMVDKVQLYDKKSDQAAFTGIDDGQKQKTINLKLKDDKKNGYFGKINLGGGTNGYYDNEVMLNIFRKKEKFAVYGIVSNTGKIGLNWQDQSSYGESWIAGADYDETNGFIGNNSSDDLDSWGGQYNGQGFPAVQTGGVHYNNKWADDKQAINGNYKYLGLQVNNATTTNSNTILGNDSVNYSNDYQKSRNTIVRNKANITYDWQFDSSSSLKVLVNGGIDHKNEASFDSSQSLTNNNLVNNSVRSLTSVSDNTTFSGTELWRKKLKKKGRTLSLNITENYTDKISTGNLRSTIDTFANNSFAGAQVIDQYKKNNNRDFSIDSKLTYSEPLSKVSSVVLNYGIVTDNNNSGHNSYNKAVDGKYNILDSVYSNNYRFNIFTQRGGAAYNLVKKKLRLNIGGNVGFSNYNQANLITDSTITRSFINWYPETNITYNIAQQTRISFYYNGNTQQPTIQQIQPVVTNDDPLNISIGNPALKPEFDNRMRLNFSDYKVLTQTYISAGMRYNFSENGITSSSSFNAFGKRVNQNINLNGNHSFSAYMYLTFKLKKIDTYLSLNGNYDASQNVNMVNNVLNTTNSGNYTGGIQLSKDKEKKYSLSLSFNATYTTSASSIQQALKTQYWVYDIQPYCELYLPWKLQVHVDGDDKITQKTAAYQNLNIFLLNAWFGKKLLKNDALLIKVSGSDLLNQNIGLDRNVSSNFTTQTTYSTIKRYFLLSAVWSFTKAGTKAPQQNF